MFIQLIAPFCLACNIWGGVGIGYAYHDVGVSLNWVAREMHPGRIDDDTLMPAVQWEAIHLNKFSVGPYVGRTICPDGHGPKPITSVGLSIQWNL